MIGQSVVALQKRVYTPRRVLTLQIATLRRNVGKRRVWETEGQTVIFLPKDNLALQNCHCTRKYVSKVVKKKLLRYHANTKLDGTNLDGIPLGRGTEMGGKNLSGPNWMGS